MVLEIDHERDKDFGDINVKENFYKQIVGMVENIDNED